MSANLALGVRHLTRKDYRVSRWRNGGGTTTEIAMEPATASLERLDFAWQVSIAEVLHSGPFSAFPGYDRHLALLDGGGILLTGSRQRPIVVIRRFAPVSFSGDRTTHGELIRGPLTDLNLICARGRTSGELSFHTIDSPLKIGPHGAQVVLHLAVGGPVIVTAMGTRAMQTGDTLIFPSAPITITIASRRDTEKAYLAVARILPANS